jgi:hypothetical protein
LTLTGLPSEPGTVLYQRSWICLAIRQRPPSGRPPSAARPRDRSADDGRRGSRGGQCACGATGKPSPPARPGGRPKQAERASTSEPVTFYPNRGAVPARLWTSLIEKATSQVEILIYAGLFLFDNHPDQLAEKAKAGAQVRIALGGPESDMVRQRGEEEGIGDNLAARAKMSHHYMTPATGTPGVELRLHDTILCNSIYRFDEDMLVNRHVPGVPAGQNPVLHFRYVPGGRTFRHYTRSFDYAWDRARPAVGVRVNMPS